MAKPVEHVAEQRAFGLEVEAVQRIIVKESPIDGRGSFEHGRRMSAIERLEIDGERLRRFAARLGGGPIPHGASQNRRAATCLDRLLKQLGTDILPLLRLSGFAHICSTRGEVMVAIVALLHAPQRSTLPGAAPPTQAPRERYNSRRQEAI